MEKPTRRTRRKSNKPLRRIQSPEKFKPALFPVHSTFRLWSSTVSAAILLPLYSTRSPPAASASRSSRLGAGNQGQPITATLTSTSYHSLFPLANSWRPSQSFKQLSPPLSKGGAGRGAGSAPSERRKGQPIVGLYCRPSANGWRQR